MTANGSADTITLNYTEIATGLSTVTVNGGDNGGGNNIETIDAVRTPAGVTTTLNGDTGQEHFGLADPGFSVSQIQGPVIVNGGANVISNFNQITATCGQTTRTIQQTGGDDLQILGNGEVAPATWTVNATTIQHTGAANITYSGIEAVDMEGGSGADTINVATTAAGTLTEFFVGNGANVFTITTTGSPSTAIIAGGNDVDTFSVLNTGDGSGVELRGGAGADVVTITTTGANSALLVNGGLGVDTISVLGSSAGNVTQIDSGAESDTISIAPGQGGTVCSDQAPLPVTVVSLRAARTRGGVVIRWRTGTEAGELGFNVYGQRGSRRVRLNKRVLPALGRVGGASYSFLDRLAPRHKALRYWLQDVDVRGKRTWHGPIRVAAA